MDESQISAAFVISEPLPHIDNISLEARTAAFQEFYPGFTMIADSRKFHDVDIDGIVVPNVMCCILGVVLMNDPTIDRGESKALLYEALPDPVQAFVIIDTKKSMRLLPAMDLKDNTDADVQEYFRFIARFDAGSMTRWDAARALNVDGSAPTDKPE